MNRNLDGSLLSIDDLRAVAVHVCGENAEKLALLEGHLHSDNLFRSHLTNITAAARFSMFMGGGEQLLVLDSRTPMNCPGFVEPPRTRGVADVLGPTNTN